MNKKLLTFLLIPALMVSVSGHAVVISDPLQYPQAVLQYGQSALSTAQTYLKAAQAYKTLIANGYAGFMKLTDLDQLETMLVTKIKAMVNQNIRNSLSDSLKQTLGSDITNKLTVDDISGINADFLKQLGEKKLTNLTQEELKNLLGNDLYGKLSSSQLNNLKNNPQSALSLAQGLLETKQGATKGLEGLGIKGNSLAGQIKNSGVGPDSNRSDAFMGTGNGSSAQAQQAMDAFQKTRENIRTYAQLPETQEGLNEVTSDQYASIRLLQSESIKELSTRGLSKAWIRQAVVTQRLPEQEKAAKKMFDEQAKSMRSVIKVVSYISLMSVEAENFAGSVFSADLATKSSMENASGSLTNPAPTKAEAATDTTDTSSASQSTGR
ncbi:MAG: hypothetical protein ACI4QM_02485 [Alphaproteobacteria bacterium]